METPKVPCTLPILFEPSKGTLDPEGKEEEAKSLGEKKQKDPLTYWSETTGAETQGGQFCGVTFLPPSTTQGVGAHGPSQALISLCFNTSKTICPSIKTFKSMKFSSPTHKKASQDQHGTQVAVRPLASFLTFLYLYPSFVKWGQLTHLANILSVYYVTETVLGVKTISVMLLFPKFKQTNKISSLK